MTRGAILLGWRVVVMQKLCVHGPEWCWMTEKMCAICIENGANYTALHTDALLMRRPCQHHFQTLFWEKENKTRKMFPPKMLAR